MDRMALWTPAEIRNNLMAIPRPQELTELIYFRTTTAPYDASTGIGTESATAVTAYARIEAAGGTIQPEDQQHQIASQRFEIWTQYNASISAFHQIEWGTRTLTISEPPQKVTDLNRRQWYMIIAEEVIERTL